MAKSGNRNVGLTILIGLVIIIAVLLISQCESRPGNGSGDNETNNDDYVPPDVDVPPSIDDSDEPLACADVTLVGYGDLDSVCREQGSCPAATLINPATECHHYWDYTNKVHKCGCTETFWCGQYCYEYYFDNGCECPPNSEQEWTSRSYYQCVPDGYYCENGAIVEIVGVWPE